MPLVDVRGFNLGFSAGDVLQQGQQTQGQNLRNQILQQQFQQQQGQFDRQAQIRQLLGQAGQAQPQTQQQQQLATQTAGLGGEQALAEQPRAQFSEEELKQAAREIDPKQANEIIKQFGLDDATKRAEMSRFAAQLQTVPFERRGDIINARARELQEKGRDASQTLQLLDLGEVEQNRGLLGIQLADLSTKERFAVTERRRAAEERVERGAEIPAGQREFESLLEGLSETDKETARRIKLGLTGRAVGSAIQTITGAGTAEEVGKTSAIIKQREKFGELTGASRAKSIDKGFERITKIDKGILNIDRAISAIRGGAGTGAIQKLLPSIKAASVELDQIRNEMALDVIGGVTLGAISEAELDLTKLVALPVGLEGGELIRHLEDRKTAQTKLRDYFQEQIDFLDQGGTVAGFLRSKRAESTINTQTATTEELQAEAARLRGQ